MGSIGCSWMPLVAALPLLAGAGQPAPLNLEDPDDALQACRKLVGSIVDGRAVFYVWEGRVWGRVPWERDRLLFAVQGVSTRACGPALEADDKNGFRLVSREVMLYLDPATHAVLERWSNPWTGEEVEVLPVANDPVNVPMSALLRRRMSTFVFPGVIRSGQAWLALEVPLYYPSPLAGAYQRFVGGYYRALETFTFFADAADLQRRGQDLEHVSFSWTRISPWLPWMAMGDRPGELVISAAGVRVAAWHDVPQPLRSVVEERFPAFRTPPPLADTRPNATSWTEFARRLAASQPSPPAFSGATRPK